VKVSQGLEKLLANFVFRDCRLESHPKLLSSQVYFASGQSHLELVAAVSKHPLSLGDRKLKVDGSLAGLVLQSAEAVVISDVSPIDRIKVPDIFETRRSILTVPIVHGSEVVGVLSLDSTEKQFFRPEDIGRIQLLGALIAFIHARSKNLKANTDAAARLGRALSGVRAELGLTQDELAYRGGLNRMALSQWERGRWPPSLGPIYQWCTALELVSEDNLPQVSFLDVTPQMLLFLRDNPQELQKISPERFEHLIAERIDRMGYDVQLTGATTRRDGGIDLIAVPKMRTVGSSLMAVQVKHHCGDRTTGRSAADRLLAWKDSPFRIGLLVTNTTFSKDARWLADQVGNKAFLRLRDFEDLKRWLQGQFDSEFDWREIPDVITLAPGITIPVPKGRLTNSRDIWPLSDTRMLDNFPKH
jgi:transcriptional regulator with XRE-family HTH domain